MIVKTTTQLFKGKYQYKVVLVCPGAHYFRSGNMDDTLKHLNSIKIIPGNIGANRRGVFIKSQDDLDYAHKLRNAIVKLSDYDIRVESPWLTLYTNSKQAVDKLTKINESKVKYISVPPENITLEEGTVILPKVPFEFKVTLGKTTSEHSTFVEWAEKSDKIRITKTTKAALLRPMSWGGGFFYVTGEKMLLMAKMHLGGSITRIDRIVKA